MVGNYLAIAWPLFNREVSHESERSCAADEVRILILGFGFLAIASGWQPAVAAILDPSDISIGIHTGAPALNGRYPGCENPPKAIDGTTAGAISI